MTTLDRDPGLDTPLDLHGQMLFVDEVGHWVKFVVVRTEATAERPHRLSYSLTLHAPDSSSTVSPEVRSLKSNEINNLGVVQSDHSLECSGKF